VNPAGQTKPILSGGPQAFSFVYKRQDLTGKGLAFRAKGAFLPRCLNFFTLQFILLRIKISPIMV
jgi:hypothetical protein